MKSLLLLLLLFVLTNLSSAQPTVTSDWAPQNGDKVKSVTTVNNSVTSEGPSGNGVAWDFSQATPNPDVPEIEFTYVAASEVSSSSNFPTANQALVASVSPDSFFVNFFRKTSSDYTTLGGSAPGILRIYSDPLVQITFPFSFGDQHSDSFEASLEVGDFITESYGTMTTMYDGYGTLSTPIENFDNVVRIKSVMTNVDSSNLSGVESINTTNSTSYIWLRQTLTNSLASFVRSQTTTEIRIKGLPPMVTEGPETTSFSYASGDLISSNRDLNKIDQLSLLAISPNPVSDFININIESKCNCNVVNSILTINGNRLQTKQERLYPGKNLFIYSASKITPGVHIFEMKMPNKIGATHQTFLVQ